MSRYVQVFTIGHHGEESVTTFSGNIVEDDQGVLTADGRLMGMMFLKTLDMIAGWANAYRYVSPIKFGEPTDDLFIGQTI